MPNPFYNDAGELQLGDNRSDPGPIPDPGFADGTAKVCSQNIGRSMLGDDEAYIAPKNESY